CGGRKQIEAHVPEEGALSAPAYINNGGFRPQIREKFILNILFAVLFREESGLQKAFSTAGRGWHLVFIIYVCHNKIPWSQTMTFEIIREVAPKIKLLMC